MFFNNQYQGRDNLQRNDRLNFGVTSLLVSDKMGEINFFVGQSQKLSGTQNNVSLPNKDRQSHIINSISWNLNEKFNFLWFALNDHHDLNADNSDFHLVAQ